MIIGSCRILTSVYLTYFRYLYVFVFVLHSGVYMRTCTVSTTSQETFETWSANDLWNTMSPWSQDFTTQNKVQVHKVPNVPSNEHQHITQLLTAHTACHPFLGTRSKLVWNHLVVHHPWHQSPWASRPTVACQEVKGPVTLQKVNCWFDR